RRHQYKAQHFFIGWRSNNGWLGSRCRSLYPTQDGHVLYQLGETVLSEVWRNEIVTQVQITALDPALHLQCDLFETTAAKSDALHRAIDEINTQYGEFTIMPAPLLERTKMHNVIAPAWKPHGHRQSL